MEPITVIIGAETYKVLDVVERTADKSLYGAGTYVYIEDTHLEQYPVELQWRAKCEVVIKPQNPEYRFIAWNMSLTLGSMYNSRINHAIAAFRAAKAQEAQNVTV